ncbi:MAG: Ldh family oxidoreductase, partial [Betaproteobacteria bacterium]|nr:Ldh family oxidoreductase [Betaproteobacteria bacterium]
MMLGHDILSKAAHRLLAAAGAEAAIAHCVAQALLEADLLGHDTHGLALLAAYVDELRAGR